jgi:starvation-inducible outer membrane lipoprotein
MQLASLKHRVLILLGTMTVGLNLAACASKAGPIPGQYRDKVDQNITYGALRKQPEGYEGKVVALGGVIVNARYDEKGRTWMFIRNRPLDADMEPHLPVSRDEHDAFWAIVDQQQLKMNFKMWTRVTVIGRVSNESPSQLGAEWKKGKEPVVETLFLHGWEGLGSYTPGRNPNEDVQGTRGQFGSPSNLKKN